MDGGPQKNNVRINGQVKGTKYQNSAAQLAMQTALSMFLQLADKTTLSSL